MTLVVLCVFIFFIAFIGAAVGSFLNVVIWRVPEKMSLISPPSHCPKCGAPVRWFDNIPILSWFILRGKCRDCHEPISFRYPLVEALSCFIALLVSVSIFFGGFAGHKTQCLYWNEFASFIETWGPLLQPSDSPEVLDKSIVPEITSFVVDDFIRLIFVAAGLSLFYTVLADCALMLGFVQYDRTLPPKSLLVTALVGVLLTAPMIRWLDSSELNVQMNEVTLFVLSALLGAAPALGVRKKERSTVAILGSVWGVVSGGILALPGSILCLLVATVIRKKTGRSTLGIVVYSALAILLIGESIYFFVR